MLPQSCGGNNTATAARPAKADPPAVAVTVAGCSCRLTLSKPLDQWTPVDVRALLDRKGVANAKA